MIVKHEFRYFNFALNFKLEARIYLATFKNTKPTSWELIPIHGEKTYPIHVTVCLDGV